MNHIKRNYYPLQKDLNDLFGLFLKGNGDDSSFVDTGTWAPAVDIKEEKDRFMVIADVPGVDKNDIHIALENNLLTLHGERTSIHIENKEGYSRKERMTGQFYRHFSLPQTADESQISANYKNGVLEISIPKKTVGIQKRIEITTDNEEERGKSPERLSKAKNESHTHVNSSKKATTASSEAQPKKN